MTPALQRLPGNPLVQPSDITFLPVSGAFNPGAAVDHRTGDVVLLVRLFESATRRSSLALARSRDGVRVDSILDQPAVTRDAGYEEWGVEDARVTWLAEEERYAITYTGYSAAGPRVCLITTDDLLAPERYRRHGPRIAGDNKNCVVFPRRVNGRYVILHRPMPRIVVTTVAALEDEWLAAAGSKPIVGPRAGSWRSSRVGAGAPPLLTEIGWLLPIHGATAIEEGNVYSMGWVVLDADDPRQVRYVSDAPALTPEAPYEVEAGPIPQVDMANFRTGVRVVFPQGMVERGDDLIVYYGAADVCVAGARVNRRALVEWLRGEIAAGRGAPPL